MIDVRSLVTLHRRQFQSGRDLFCVRQGKLRTKACPSRTDSNGYRETSCACHWVRGKLLTNATDGTSALGSESVGAVEPGLSRGSWLFRCLQFYSAWISSPKDASLRRHRHCSPSRTLSTSSLHLLKYNLEKNWLTLWEKILRAEKSGTWRSKTVIAV